MFIFFFLTDPNKNMLLRNLIKVEPKTTNNLAEVIFFSVAASL